MKQPIKVLMVDDENGSGKQRAKFWSVMVLRPFLRKTAPKPCNAWINRRMWPFWTSACPAWTDMKSLKK